MGLAFCRDCFSDTETEKQQTITELRDAEMQERLALEALDQLQRGRTTLSESVKQQILGLTAQIQDLRTLKLALGSRIAALQAKDQHEGRKRIAELVKVSKEDMPDTGEEEQVDAYDSESMESKLVAQSERRTKNVRATALALGVRDVDDALQLARDLLKRDANPKFVPVPDEPIKALEIGDPEDEAEQDKHSERVVDVHEDVPLIA